MATYSAIRTQLLAMLRDPDAARWSSNDELYFLISNAERWLARRLGSYSRGGRFKYRESITVSANTETYAVSGLTKSFVAVRYIDWLSNANVQQPMEIIQEGDENLYRQPTIQAGGGLVPSYFLRDGNLHILPTSPSSQTYYVTYQWIPAVKTSGTDTTETPAEYDDMLLARAAFDAMGREGESEKTFKEKYAVRLDEIEGYEFSRQDRGVGETVKDTTSRYLFG